MRLVVLALALAACTSDPYPQLYATSAKAPSMDFATIEALDNLGPTVIDGGVNFGVWSNRATRVDLLLFDDPNADRPVQQMEMSRVGDVWNLFVEGVGYGQHYGFVAWGPNWPYDPEWLPGKIDGFLADVDAEGNRFDPNKLLIDPYAKALHREHDWSRGSTASGPARTQSTWGAGVKGVVVRTDTYAWSAAEADWRAMREQGEGEGHRFADLIVYEVHPKGFTKDPAGGVDHPGTYRGIGEKAAYLKDLGITAVELLPVHEKPLDGGYWGYNTLNFFAPELAYSEAFTQRNRPDEVVDEFKWMVDQLHQQGIEVILDVVYNHTGEGGFWREKLYTSDVGLDPTTAAQSINFDPKEIAGLYSYRGLDNYGYYALEPNNQSYWNNTGVGNQTRPNNTPMERLILDSLRYYVDDMHVDGFRFDLAGILGEVDLDYNNWDDPNHSVLGKITDDPVLQRYNTRLIAEPWTAGGWYGPLIGAYPASTTKPGYGFGEWNSRYRDWWRAFLNNDDWKLNSKEADADGGFVMLGSQDYYTWNGRGPQSSVNFFTAHDGFTLYDLFSFNQKQNLCGVLNPVCCTSPTSAWCETESGESNNRSRDWGDEAMKRQMMRDAFVAMLISRGTPMLLGGDEWMRTQYGNNNAYSTQADNEWNWFRWGEWTSTGAPERHRMHDFVRQAIRVRKDHPDAFAPSTWDSGLPMVFKSPANTDAVGWGGKSVMLHYYDDGRGASEVLVLINMENAGTQDFTLPGGRTWVRRLDTQRWWDEGYLDEPGVDPMASHNGWGSDAEPVTGGTYGVPSRNIVVLESR